jgi:hypothetical protein
VHLLRIAVEQGPSLQQERDRQTERHLDAYGQACIEQRNAHRVPEFRIAEKRDVVVEPDEALQRRQVEAIA